MKNLCVYRTSLPFLKSTISLFIVFSLLGLLLGLFGSVSESDTALNFKLIDSKDQRPDTSYAPIPGFYAFTNEQNWRPQPKSISYIESQQKIKIKNKYKLQKL